MKIKIAKKDNTYNDFTLTVTGITPGQILALQRALDVYGVQSTVANDIGTTLFNAANDSKDLQDFLANKQG